ncbi:MAG: ABC transporter permease [Gammaproteobacteria bacterium]|nr:ABC transporter permease [Gammaproteobacteria bacterium]MCP4982043.1 ABC transporter permease [Gammaproteobacteria bacterium]
MSMSNAVQNSRKMMVAGLILPPLVVITLFMIVPVGIMLVYSFLESGTYGGVVWNFSTEAYIQFLFERDIFDETLSFSSDYLGIFSRSVMQAFIATGLCLIIGIPTAYYIATRPARQKNIWLFMITIPYWVNLLVRTIALLFVLRSDGPVNDTLMFLHIVSEPLKLSYNEFAIGTGLVYSFLPFMILPLYAAFERFDFTLLDAAYDLYASRTKAFFKILLPIMKPGLIAGSLLVFIPSIGSFLAPDILGGGKKMMIGNLIAMQFQGSRNWPFGAAVAMILLTLTLITLIFFAVRASNKTKS